MNKRICPVCGIGTLEKILTTVTLSDPYGIEKTIEVSEYKCPACEAEGDLFGENDRAIQDEYKKMRAEAVASMLEKFHSKKISLSAAERVLELPQRTLSKWKNKSMVPSASAALLLRYINLFPWLLDVADNKFNLKSAQQIHVAAAMRDLCEMTKGSEATNLEDLRHSTMT